MEIFNIHLFELLLIAGLALVVFGPERLPELGRMAGKQIARFLAWQQQFPELKVINEVRAEFEQEIASLRDELVRTRRQLDLSQEVNLNSLRDELRPMLSLRDELKVSAGGAPPPRAAGQGPTTPNPAADPAAAPAADPAIEPATPALAADPAIDSAAPSPTDALEGIDAARLSEASLDAAADSALGTASGPAAPPVRPAPAGTVQASLRPNRLAATAPTTVLKQPTVPFGDAPGMSEADAQRLQPGPHEGGASPSDSATAHVPPDTSSPNGQHPAPAVHSGDASARSDADAQRLQPGAPALASDELRLALAQIERLSADLHALVSALHERGLLGADWQPGAAISEQETLSR